MLIDISRLSQGKRFVFIHRFAKRRRRRNTKRKLWESMKLKLKEEQERAIKEFDFGVN